MRLQQRQRRSRLALGYRAKVASTRRHASRRISRVVHCYATNSFVKKSGDDDADPLKYFSALHASCSFL
jgi:hypothetical protein